MSRRSHVEDETLALKPQLAREGVSHVALFGSRSRGDHRPESDLDLLIEVDEARPFSVLDLIGVEHAIGDHTGLTVNVVMRRSLMPRFGQAIASDIVEIF